MTQTPSRVLATLLLAAGLGAAACLPAHAASSAAPEEAASAPAHVARPETAKLLKEAQERQAAKDWVGELAKLKEVEAIGNLNPYEAYLVAQGRAVASYYSKDYATAAVNFRKTIDSGMLTPEAKLQFLEVLFQLQYGDLKQYKEALATIDEYRAAGGTKTEVLNAAPQVLYAAGDNAGAAKAFQKQVDAEIAAGGKPSERTLRMMVGAQQAADDDAGLGQTAEKLALYYPKKDVWYDVVQRAGQAPGVVKIRLDALRQRATILGYADKEGNLLATHAELAARAGYPAEARALLEQAYARNIVPANIASDVARLRDSVNRAYADEKKSDKATEQAARASKDGEALAGYGLELFLDGQTDRGLAMMEAGLQKGAKKPDEARLHLGMALLRAGRLDDARKTLEPISGKEGAGALARVYLLWIRAGAKFMDAAPAAAAPAAKAASGG